jgi:hypothetical protein
VNASLAALEHVAGALGLDLDRLVRGVGKRIGGDDVIPNFTVERAPKESA